MEILKEYSLLIEEIGLVIEERADLSPLAARIYATLILASEEGLTFERITTVHHASKSSVSNNLNVLVKLSYVEYYTKPGERKRYFRTSKFYIKTAMEKYSQLFKKEIEVIEKIDSFNEKHHPEKFKNEHPVRSFYQDFLKELHSSFENKIKEINTFENQS